MNRIPWSLSLALLLTAACPDPGALDGGAPADGGASGEQDGGAADDCGNGTLNTDEICEGFDLRGATCASEGFAGGQLACTDVCTLDVSGCEGNGGSPGLELYEPDTTNAFCVSLSSCGYDFGAVEIGGERSLRIDVANTGSAPLTDLEVELLGTSDPSFTLDDGLPSTLAPGGVDEVTVRFSPVLQAQVSGTLVIRSSDPAFPEVEIALDGEGVDLGAPAVVIDPTQCDFGATPVGVAASCSFTIQNDGSRDLQINAFDFGDQTDTDVFQSMTFVPVPTFIAPGAGITVELTATPSTAGTTQGELVLQTNAPDAEQISVALTVQGT